MTERSVTHATFQLERTYDTPTKRVWAAFADPAAKARWFHGPEEWGPDQHEMDFRVGGIETSEGGPPGEPVHRFDARYYEIVDESRIVFAYDMFHDNKKLSTSLTTIEFTSEDNKTRIVFTEQGAFYDGHEDPKQREEGTAGLLEAIAESLQ